MKVESQMDLLMAQIGAVDPAKSWQIWWWLHPWRRRIVTRVDWRGCMATERHVERTGVLVGRERRQLYGGGQKRYDGILVDYNQGRIDWEPLDNVRFAGKDHRVEVW